MAEQLMQRAINRAKQALCRNQYFVNLFGITFTLAHAHDDQWQFLTPSGDEIFRLVRKHDSSIEVLMV